VGGCTVSLPGILSQGVGGLCPERIKKKLRKKNLKKFGEVALTRLTIIF
jgi:hypothetical protein